MQGTMQDWELRVPHLIDYAAREHGTREIVTRWPDGSIERSNWAGVASEARKLSQAFAGFGQLQLLPAPTIATASCCSPCFSLLLPACLLACLLPPAC